jgi:PAS domain S-box-containing protein
MPKILVVDDEAAITTHLEEKLHSLGYEVVGRASSGPEAVERARLYRPDLVLMDIVMEGEYDGIEAAKKLREELDIPVVFLTAYGDDYLITRAKAVQPLGYILKPFQDMALKAAIEVALFNLDVSRRLKESEEYWRLLAENIEAGVVIADCNKIIFFWNRGAELIFKYPAAEAIGQSLLFLFSESFRPQVQQELEQALATGKTPFQGKWTEVVGLRKDWSKFALEIHLSPFLIQNKTMFILLARDITEKRKTEETLKASLQEKENLLAEIQRQMKNNLEAIFSLIDLKFEFMREKQTLTMLKESHDRIRAIALMKEKLEKAQSLGKIDFKNYLTHLAHRLLAVFDVDQEDIRLEVDIAGLLLDIKTAILCGLIVTELVSNAIKYAFPAGRKGMIRLKAFRQSPEKIVLEVSDDGIGLPPDINLRASRTLGLQLVRDLVHQLQGTMRVNRERGTKYHLLITSA